MIPKVPNVQSFYHEDSGTWSYLVVDPSTRAAAIIDPVLDFDFASGRTDSASARELLNALTQHNLALQWLLETHAHADHLSASNWLKVQFPAARVAIGAGICGVQKHFRQVFNLDPQFPIDGSQFDHLIGDSERFSLGTLDVVAVPAPGHTLDSIAYLIGDALFVGDSLFMPDAGTARCDFPGGDAAMLYRSIQQLFALPDATRVFVCHDYPPDDRDARCETTIGAQKRENIHARQGVTEAEFVALRSARDATLAVPKLLLPSLQVNIRAGALPEPEANGVRYLKLPLNRL